MPEYQKTENRHLKDLKESIQNTLCRKTENENVEKQKMKLSKNIK